MKTIIILGGGTAGTIAAHKLRKHLDAQDWRIIVVDKEECHYYQPGYLFVPFGVYQPQDILKPKRKLLPKNVETIFARIELIEPQENRVRLSTGQVLNYDYLVIATGCDVHPEETPGLMDSWGEAHHTFYNIEGASQLAKALQRFDGGRLVVNIVETPIKCPVAPLEFVFYADWYFNRRGIRNKVDIVLATPLPGAFTKPYASSILGGILEKKGIHVEPDFYIMEADTTKQVIRSYDEREVGYDLLVSIPVNKGADVIGASGMGDELNYVPTNKYTLQSEQWPNVFVLGDASNIPASKAGATIHFMMDTMVENLLALIHGREMTAQFDGHANCFIETGYNKALLIDFNYEVEPLSGTYPLPVIGPLSLLRESYLNHLAKLFFKELYWHVVLQGIDIPFMGSKMSMAGKKKLPTTQQA